MTIMSITLTHLMAVRIRCRWNIGVRNMTKHLQKIAFYLRHSLRLNADVADTALQKSLRQFSKFCWPNLNYGKIYIFISNTFTMLKFTFVC